MAGKNYSESSRMIPPSPSGEPRKPASKLCFGVLGLLALLLIVAAVVVLFVMFFIVGSDPPRVSIQCGHILGEFNTQHRVYVFKGVPFAAPPVGERRWQPPVPLKAPHCWRGTLTARTFGSQCAQIDPYTHKPTGAEDCLYLNVYSPELRPQRPRAVMVYIHGGYLLFGNGSMRGYAPDERLTRDSDVVYVSIQYRVTVMGFLVTSLLPDVTGNLGLLDAVEALRWVRDNIAHFGGDPRQVTVFGQSSGASAVWGLLTSPLGRGLFHRAWLLSGSVYWNISTEQARQQNQFVLNKTRCDTRQCLYNLSAEQLVQAVYPEWDNTVSTADLPLRGRLDMALPVVDGSTAQEVDMMPAPADLRSWSCAQLHESTARRLDTFGGNLTARARALYPACSRSRDPELLFTSKFSDALTICGNHRLAGAAASALTRGRVYRYVATHWPSTPTHVMGLPWAARYAYHAVDMYGFLASFAVWMPGGPAARERRFTAALQRNVLHFARHGRPLAADWRPYPAATALIDQRVTVVDSYHGDQCKQLWDPLYRYSWVN